jgi:hypothetical protein
MFKAVDKWFPGYLRSLLDRPRAGSGVRHLIFCLCDHFEPFRAGASPEKARRTVKDWLAAYPDTVSSFLDADGCMPRHTFFYPQEDYDEEILDQLAGFCRRGFGEVEIHLHHRHDTAEGLRGKLESFRDLLHTRHGLLGVDRVKCRVPIGTAASFPAVRYGFIHGNWALCNSRPDGDWCGVNEELRVLAGTGCYADFTFPSAPSPTQPRMVNAIYYAQDRAGRPRGADEGERAKVMMDSGGKNGFEQKTQRPRREQNFISGGDGKEISSLASFATSVQNLPSSLLLITGPLALNGSRRKWGILPRLENAEISGVNPPTEDRIRLWARQGIHVTGRAEWVFVKVHTHGCVPGNAGVLLGGAMRQAHGILQREFNDGRDWRLHYVSAREMFNLVRAAEAGAAGDPGPYRDFEVVWNP